LFRSVVYNEGGHTDFFIAKFASEPCTPLSQESFETNSIKVYPNPAKHTLTVEVYESVNYELYTITGQLVKQGKLTILDNTIALQELPKGYYLLRIGDEKG
ncbi:T9SS type A sorting domain-containing protein, partial [Arthrospira platensis SPKY1]|nr:T9SS type A sorting domain-containing protein [Arthrospira platensis SPKY1]